MQYKCIRGVVSSEGVLAVGDIVKLPSEEAVILMAAGKLEIVGDEIRVAEAPAIQHGDPVMPRKGRPPRAD